MSEMAMVIDVTKCTACRGCQIACKQWNQLSAQKTKNTGSYENPPNAGGKTYTKIVFNEVAVDGKLKWLFRKEQCMHCAEASCISICPVDARGKNELGFTEVDTNKCIGCGACVSVCPFGIPQLDDARKARNCVFCLDRVLNKLTPACVKTCPSGALEFGTRKDILTYTQDIVGKSGGKLTLYGEKEYSGLHVLYILEGDPKNYGLSADGKIVGMADRLEIYAMLEKKFADSPLRTEILTVAAAKYFGNTRLA